MIVLHIFWKKLKKGLYKLCENFSALSGDSSWLDIVVAFLSHFLENLSDYRSDLLRRITTRRSLRLSWTGPSAIGWEPITQQWLHVYYWAKCQWVVRMSDDERCCKWGWRWSLSWAQPRPAVNCWWLMVTKRLLWRLAFVQIRAQHLECAFIGTDVMRLNFVCNVNTGGFNWLDSSAGDNWWGTAWKGSWERWADDLDNWGLVNEGGKADAIWTLKWSCCKIGWVFDAVKNHLLENADNQKKTREATDISEHSELI